MGKNRCGITPRDGHQEAVNQAHQDSENLIKCLPIKLYSQKGGRDIRIMNVSQYGEVM